jgi:phosphoglycerate dehydrogenase-like enzyme
LTRILLSEAAFRRVQPHLPAGLECVLMDRNGFLRFDGREILPHETSPECGWISHDLFADSLTARYLDVLMQSAALKWVQSAGAGIDHPIFAALLEKRIRLTINHSQSVGMADYVLWGVLNHFQGGNARAIEQAAHRWTQWPAREIAGTRWLILGFGAIGEAVARRAKGFGAYVTGVRRQSVQSPSADAMVTPDRMRDHLGVSDVVVLCMPQTAETTNLVDADFLAAMKPGSVLVNVGRGSAIDEAALLAALDAGKPEHALLDVFRIEPLPADSRFWDHSRVTVTPHSSAMSAGNAARTDQVFLDNLVRYLAGEALLDEVTMPDSPAATPPKSR